MKYLQPEYYPSLIPSAVTALIAFSYYFFDMKVSLWCHKTLTPAQHELFSMITKLGDSTYYIAGFLLLWIIFRYIQKNKLWETRAKFLLIAVLASGLVADLIKVVAGRYRPSEWFESQLYGFDFFHMERAMTSFPSGHTATIFAVTMSLYYLWPKSGYFIWPMALLVGFSRVAIGAHYPSDVLMGGFVGVMSVMWALAYVKPKKFRPIRMGRIRAVSA